MVRHSDARARRDLAQRLAPLCRARGLLLMISDDLDLALACDADGLHLPERVAVSMKCTFCKDRIDEARITGRTPGIHPEVTPACVNSCISGAMEFGDIDDPGSNVSRLLGETQHYRMHEELGTEPGVYYIWDKS